MKSYRDIVGDGGSNVAAQVQAQAAHLRQRLAGIRHIVGIMSGKGGVGKSTLTVNLGAALHLEGFRVAILDADINGPSVARMLGVRGVPLRETPQGMEPVLAHQALKIMSIDLFLPGEDAPVIWKAPTQNDAYTWRGMMEALALKEMLADTCWGEADFLLIDLPPGTDKLPNLVDILPRFSGSLAVSIPSQISQFVVGKAIAMARSLFQAPILGLVLNMASHICPHCGREEALFPVGQVEALSRRWDLPLLARLPFEARVAAAADAGKPYVFLEPDSEISLRFRRLANRLAEVLGLVNADRK